MTTETITCPCGKKFDYENDEADAWTASILRPKRCPECENQFWTEREATLTAEREKKFATALAGVMAEVERQTPAIFRATDVAHSAFNTEGWAAVKDWRPSSEKPWLGLIGDTGACKSRMAYLLASHTIEAMARERLQNDRRPPTFAMVPSYEVTDACGRLLHSDFKVKDCARDFLNGLRSADFLVIDDLGKGRLTPAVAAEFFALVDCRYVNLLPTIWTANSTAEEVAAPMPGDLAAPFAGRLVERSRILRFR